MSLRYHFRGADADQLRAMRAATIDAIARSVGSTPGSSPHETDPPRVWRALAAAAAAFPALTLRRAEGTRDADVDDQSADIARRLAAAWEALDGDGTPWSYLCASVLRRELETALGVALEAAAALGAPPWSVQTLVDSEPPGTAGWSWRGACPTDWRLLVMEDTRRVLVRFMTTAPPAGPAVLLHEDWYRRGEGYEGRAGLQALADWTVPRADGADPGSGAPS
jgi:hypothetical protein